MARQLKVPWTFVSLTTAELSKKETPGVTSFVNAALPTESRAKFIRYTWEELYRDHVEGRDGLDGLATYLRYKSANFKKAFAIE